MVLHCYLGTIVARFVAGTFEEVEIAFLSLSNESVWMFLKKKKKIKNKKQTKITSKTSLINNSIIQPHCPLSI